jgi:hypothetical protein
MTESFGRAAERHGTVDRWYAVGGRAVQLTFAGPALLPAVDPALAHLAVEPPAHPQLSVLLWDSASTGIPVPDVPEMPHGRQLEADQVLSAYHVVPRILSLYDPGRAEAVLWVPDAAAVPSNEIASPLRTIFHWWARTHGLQFVHGGAVARGGRAVLIAGPSGSGKSTAALACLLSGLDYLGDDYVLVGSGHPPTVHSLYNAAKLMPEQVRAFPELRHALVNPDALETEKALWFVERDYPARTPASALAVGVLVPRVTGAPESRIIPLGRARALAALAPSTIVQLSGADQWSLSAMATFLARVPCHVLEAGTDRDGLARVVSSCLEDDFTPVITGAEGPPLAGMA